jgi:hypothetical protein
VTPPDPRDRWDTLAIVCWCLVVLGLWGACLVLGFRLAAWAAALF